MNYNPFLRLFSSHQHEPFARHAIINSHIHTISAFHESRWLKQMYIIFYEKIILTQIMNIFQSQNTIHNKIRTNNTIHIHVLMQTYTLYIFLTRFLISWWRHHFAEYRINFYKALKWNKVPFFGRNSCVRNSCGIKDCEF